VKRNVLAAVLVTIAVAATGVVTASPASAGEECRYDIYNPPPPPPSYLAENQVDFVDNISFFNPYRRKLTLHQPRWSVLGVRPAPGSNYDVEISHCTIVTLATSTMSGSAVDFVALDGNRPWVATGQKELWAKVWRSGEVTDPFAVEYSADGPPLQVGIPQLLRMRGTPALIRDLVVQPGTTAVVLLTLAQGDADLALVSSGPFGEQNWARSRVQAINSSAYPGLTHERIEISVPVGVSAQTYGVVVINNASYGLYTLERF
jgi:hypothetical protein